MKKKIEKKSCSFQGREFTFSGHMPYQHNIHTVFFFFSDIWRKYVFFGKVLLFHFAPGVTKRGVIYGEVKHSEQTCAKFVGVWGQTHGVSNKLRELRVQIGFFVADLWLSISNVILQRWKQRGEKRHSWTCMGENIMTQFTQIAVPYPPSLSVSRPEKHQEINTGEILAGSCTGTKANESIQGNL